MPPSDTMAKALGPTPSSPPSASGAEAVVLSKASAAKDRVESWLDIPLLRTQGVLSLLSYPVVGFRRINRWPATGHKLLRVFMR